MPESPACQLHRSVALKPCGIIQALVFCMTTCQYPKALALCAVSESYCITTWHAAQSSVALEHCIQCWQPEWLHLPQQVVGLYLGCAGGSKECCWGGSASDHPEYTFNPTLHSRQISTCWLLHTCQFNLLQSTVLEVLCLHTR